MIRIVSSFMVRVVQRYLPDPLVLAMLLCLIVFVLGSFKIPTSDGEFAALKMAQLWGDGFWNLLAFTMQMAMIIVTGHALASSEPIKKLLRQIASFATTQTRAVMLVVFFGAVACLINWGFGLVVGALLAKEVARKLKTCDYGLLIACAYMGFMTWGGGLSGSMPLLAATPGNPMESRIGGTIPISETIFSSYNMFIIIALLVVLPALVAFMIPKEPKTIDPNLLAEEPSFQREVPKDAVIALRLEESRLLSLLIAAIGIVYLGYFFATKGFNVDINKVNLIFVVFGILLHKTPMAYVRAIMAATKGTAGVLVQFPFYASIALMMEKSGLGQMITEGFISISTKETFAVYTYISSALINFAIPSGGGHWVVQGPFVLDAAKELGVDFGKATMAIAYGDMQSNMAQPFWAIPALAIAGLGVRDIMGYCMTALIFTIPIFVIGLYFL